MKKLIENWRRYVENINDIDEARIEPPVIRKRDDEVKESEEIDENIYGVLVGRHMANKKRNEAESALEETDDWYDPAYGPSPPGYQQRKPDRAHSAARRAEQLDQVDHAAAVAAEEDAAAGVRQTKAPDSWILVADEWLEAYNYAHDAAAGSI